MIPVSFSLFLYFSWFFLKILLNLKKLFHYFILFINFFHENYFYFVMFRYVTECSGMFRVPGFIDAQLTVCFTSFKDQFNPRK